MKEFFNNIEKLYKIKEYNKIIKVKINKGLNTFDNIIFIKITLKKTVDEI